MTEKTNKSEHTKQRAFLAAYKTLGIVSQACRAAECSRTQVYEWLKDRDFKRQMDAAREEACDTLESEAMRRAVQGYEQPVFHKGEQCGVVRKYSDRLLMFLLKNARPFKFSDRPDPNYRNSTGTLAEEPQDSEI